MKKEICRNCSHFKTYYVQRVTSYERLSYGICTVHKQQHKRNETCDNFKHDELKEKRRKMYLYTSLEQAARSINDIIYIIKENIKDVD